MEKYTYKEVTETANARLGNIPEAYVSVRTVKLFVERELLKAPEGKGRCRYFYDNDLDELICIRRLQIVYGQSIKSIKRLDEKVCNDIGVDQSGSKNNLARLVAAIKVFEEMGIDPIAEIKAYKEGKRILVREDTGTQPYRLVEFHKESYFEENGKVCRRLESITDDNGCVVYFKPSEIEKYSKLNMCVSEKKEADKIRKLIDLGIMTSPRYKYKGEDYFTDPDLAEYVKWMDFILEYRISYDNLNLLRTRIEYDIDNLFYRSDLGYHSEAYLAYNFKKQTTVFRDCLRSFYGQLIANKWSVAGYTKKDNLKIIKDYLNGFFSLCYNLNANYPSRHICLKKTPLDRLSTEQLKIGFAEGKFTQQEVEKVLKAKEAEVKALKSIINESERG